MTKEPFMGLWEQANKRKSLYERVTGESYGEDRRAAERRYARQVERMAAAEQKEKKAKKKVADNAARVQKLTAQQERDLINKAKAREKELKEAAKKAKRGR